MNKITVSAPGKLMLFGEHAVVYGRPCIVTSVDQRMFVTVEKNNSGMFVLNAPEVEVSNYSKPIKSLGIGEIPKGAQFIEIAVKNVLAEYKIEVNGLAVSTRSEFSSKFGFGSSSASTVCTVKALSELFALKLSQRQIFDSAYKTVLDVQTKGSGFDVASAVFGGTLYFVTGGKTIESLKIKNIPLIIGYSGIKADTVILIDKVAEKFSGNKKRLEQIYDEVASIVDKAKQYVVLEKWDQVGRLMNDNQKLLSELGVSISKLDDIISSAITNGAYGAKLSGAGGGDCMIALGPDDKMSHIKKAIENAGGEILKVKTNAQGVRIEK